MYCKYKTRHGLGELVDNLMQEHQVFNKNIQLNTDENVSQTHPNHNRMTIFVYLNASIKYLKCSNRAYIISY